MPTKICVICKSPFHVKPSHAKGRFCCAKPCANKRQSIVRQTEIESGFGKPLKELLTELHWDKQLDANVICQMLGIQPRTFMDWCDSLQIPRRSISAAVKLQWVGNKARKLQASEIGRRVAKQNCAKYGAPSKSVAARQKISQSKMGDKNPMRRPEVREKVSKSNMGRPGLRGEKSPLYAKFGPLNANWKGGKITYRGVGWRGIIVQVKRRDGYKCTRCGTTKRLQVHHKIPYRETHDNSLENLITLCARCHAIVENKRVPLVIHVNQFD